MAKKNKVEIDVEVDDNGSTKKLALDSKKASEGLDKVGKSARTADRNTKGAAQASSGASKNFSKMSQGMGGLVGAYATFAASVFALSAAFQFFKNASDLAVLEQSQLQYAQNTGVAMGSLTASLRKSSQGMLDFQQAASASAMGLAKGFSADQMNAMADGALKVSNVLGRNFTDSFDRLTRGVSKAEPELLDELGITLRLETAKKKYAESLGLTADALTTADASQAVYLETMRQLDMVVSDQEAQANPFIQLGATFSDLAKTVSGALLPPFKAIATFLNNNAKVAAIFFGAIGLSIVKNMPFVGEMGTALKEFFDGQKAKADEASTALENYQKEIEETKKATSAIRTEGAKELKSGAGKAVKAGADSPVLARAAAGKMKGADTSNLKRALKSAEKQYKKHGKITTGIFKDVGIDIAREIGKGLAKTEKKTRSTGQKIKGFFKRINLQAKKAGAILRKRLAKGFDAAGRAAKRMGKAMKLAMKATVILGIVQMIYDMVMALVNAPRSIMDGIISVVKGSLKFIEVIVNGAISAINYVKEQANRIPGVELEMTEKATFGTDLGNSLENAVKSSSVYKMADGWQQSREAAEDFKETLRDIKSEAVSAGAELKEILSGKVFDEDAVNKAGEKTYDPMKAQRAKAEAIKSLPFVDLMKQADSLKGDPEKYAEALASIKTQMKGVENLSPAFAAALESGSIEKVKEATKQAGRYTANIDSATDMLENMSQALQGKGAEATRIYIESLKNTGDAAIEAGNSLGLTTDVLDKLDKRFESAGGIESYIQGLRDAEEAASRLRFATMGNQINIMNAGSNLNKGANEDRQKQLAIRGSEIQLEQKMLNLSDLNRAATLLNNDEERAAHALKVEQAVIEIGLARTKLTVAEQNADKVKQLGKGIGDSLTNNMTAAFDALVAGTKSAKEAFADMAKAIISDIARMITKMMMMKMLKSMFGSTDFGSFLGFDDPVSPRAGGIFNNGRKMSGYATGGVARGSTSGYPAILHGTEAVVPLPNGRSIPVEMKDSGATNNNIVVNVSTDGQTGKQGSTGPDMDKLGGAIAQAVQVELQNQKRSGGILNPYGVA